MSLQTLAVKPKKRQIDEMNLGKWQDFCENASVGIFRSTKAGKILLANRMLAQIFGYASVHQFLKAVPDVSQIYLNPSERQRIFDIIEKQVNTEPMEAAIRRPDGNIVWIVISARALKGKSGETLYEGFVTDITPRKLAQQSLRESEKRFRLLVEQAGDAFFIHDYKGRILDVNRQACTSLGYQREELLDMSIYDIDIEVRQRKHRMQFWEKLQSEEYITFEGVQKRKNGTPFPVEVRLGRLDIDNKRLLLSLVRDISERKRRINDLEHACKEVAELKEHLEKENVALQKEINLEYRYEKIVGESDAIKDVLTRVEKVAQTDACVLILGETGTGKELIAHAIHSLSSRRGMSMVQVNCAALPATLIESELFGREKGAYTGAMAKQLGRFEASDNSTIFLDEIGDLPLELQAKLLRVLQDGEFERLGSTKTIQVNSRLITATNRDLFEQVQKGEFRKDLYYRINVFPIVVPPLRDRIEDIPLLMWYFVDYFNERMGKQVSNISQETMDMMLSYPWPGNVRELKNGVERAMILTTGSTLAIDEPYSAPVDLDPGDQNIHAVEKRHIERVLAQTSWKVSGKNGAALILGLKPTTLEARMKKLGIHRPK